MYVCRSENERLIKNGILRIPSIPRIHKDTFISIGDICFLW